MTVKCPVCQREFQLPMHLGTHLKKATDEAHKKYAGRESAVAGGKEAVGQTSVPPTAPTTVSSDFYPPLKQWEWQTKAQPAQVTATATPAPTVPLFTAKVIKNTFDAIDLLVKEYTGETVYNVDDGTAKALETSLSTLPIQTTQPTQPIVVPWWAPIIVTFGPVVALPTIMLIYRLVTKARESAKLKKASPQVKEASGPVKPQESTSAPEAEAPSSTDNIPHQVFREPGST